MSLGPRCERCQRSEADCARAYPCCIDCSHFTEPEAVLDLTPDFQPRPRQEKTVTTPASVTPAVNSTSRPASLPELLVRARQTNDPKVTRAAERAQAASDTLSAALTEYETRSTARREVDRLEKQLAEAKARLKGGPTTRPSARSSGTFPCTKGCGYTAKNGTGRAAHERHCTGTAA